MGKMPTSSTVTALRIPPALSKAQGKLRSPAPRADFSIMKMAPMEPRRGSAVISSGGLAEAEASRLMLSLANSSMLQPAEHTDAAAVLRGQGEEGGGVDPDGGLLLLPSGTARKKTTGYFYVAFDVAECSTTLKKVSVCLK